MKRLKEFFGAMKDFFRHPVIGIDRILSSGIKWQLLFLLGVIVAAILLFIVIEWLTGSILTIKENDPRNIFVDVYYHFAHLYFLEYYRPPGRACEGGSDRL